MSKAVAKIVDEKGGASAFAVVVGRSAGAVRLWKHRNRFPREAWPEIVKAFPDLTLDRLMTIEAEQSADTVSPSPETRSAA